MARTTVAEPYPSTVPFAVLISWKTPRCCESVGRRRVRFREDRSEGTPRARRAGRGVQRDRAPTRHEHEHEQYQASPVAHHRSLLRRGHPLRPRRRPCPGPLKGGQKSAKHGLKSPRVQRFRRKGTCRRRIGVPYPRAARGLARRRPSRPRAARSSARCWRCCCSMRTASCPTERLIDELWGDTPPETARAALQVYVAGLRKALGDGRRDADAPRRPGTCSRSSRVRSTSSAFDASRDRGARRRADAGRSRRAAPRGARALARRPADRARRRAVACERGGTARGAALASARGADRRRSRARTPRRARPELEALVGEQPYRERFRAQLMLALYRRAGRPMRSPRTSRAPKRSRRASGSSRAPELRVARATRCSSRIRRSTAPHAAAGGGRQPTLVAVTPWSGVALARGARRPRRGSWARAGRLRARDDAASSSRPNSVAVIDPDTNEVVDVGPGRESGPGRSPPALDRSGSATSSDRNLTRIDIQQPDGFGTDPTRRANADGARVRSRCRLGRARTARRASAASSAQFGDVVDDIAGHREGVYSSTGSVAAGDATRSGPCSATATLARLDPARPVRSDRRHRQTASPADVAVGYGSVWVSSAFRSTVQRFSPFDTRRRCHESPSASRPAAIVAGFGDVWVDQLRRATSCTASTSAAARSPRRSPSATAPRASRSERRRVGREHGGGTVSRIDPETNKVVKTIEVGEAPGRAGRRGKPRLGDSAGALSDYFRQTVARSSAGRRTTHRGSTRTRRT